MPAALVRLPAAAPTPTVPRGARPLAALPLYTTVLDWVTEALDGRPYSRPLCKRLALLLTGLLVGGRATVSALAATIHGLHVTPAQEASIVRRFQRLVADVRLDPARLLADVLATRLPVALAAVSAAHHQDRGPGPWIRLVIDESSVRDHTHLVQIGWALPGLVLPLAIRTWPQNTPQPEAAYWTEVDAACLQVQRLLPPEVRAHVVLVADRFYGVPHLLDLCHQLGWHVLVRAQGQIRLRVGTDGPVRTLRSLVPGPGTAWYGGWGLDAAWLPSAPATATEATATATAAEAEAEAEAVWIFKKAGWRRVQVAASWIQGQAEPWLIVTTLPATPAALEVYAHRWAIERTFLAWKSHGWDLEACGVTDPVQVAHLLSGVALATWWRVALALPLLEEALADLAPSAASDRPRQLRLPLGPDPRWAHRPWIAKFSLLTWGAKALSAVDPRTQTPALTWTVPPWSATTWTAHCRAITAAARAAPAA